MVLSHIIRHNNNIILIRLITDNVDIRFGGFLHPFLQPVVFSPALGIGLVAVVLYTIVAGQQRGKSAIVVAAAAPTDAAADSALSSLVQ